MVAISGGAGLAGKEAVVCRRIRGNQTVYVVPLRSRLSIVALQH